MIGPVTCGSRLARALFEVLAAIGHGRKLGDRDVQAKARELSRVFTRICEMHGFEVEVHGALPNRTAVLIANHLSYLDPVIVCAHLPCAPIAKAEIGGWPLIGTAARALGITLVERENVLSRAVALRKALRALRGGTSVLNFPEGTTTVGDQVLPFHRGIFGIASIAEVPIIPIGIVFEDTALAWTGDDTFLPHYLRTASTPRSRVHLKIGEPMFAAAHESAEAFAERARRSISMLIEENPYVTTASVSVSESRPDAVLSPRLVV